MDRTLRSILWILVTLVLLSSFSAGWFFIAKERLFDEYTNLEALFKTSMERLNRELASFEKQNVELKSKLETIKKELSVLESNNKDLMSRYEEVLQEKEDLNRELVRVKKGKFFLEARLKEMESDRFVAGLLKEKVTLEVELKRLRGSLDPKSLEIENLQKDILDLDVKLSNAVKEKELLGQKLADSTEIAEILSRDLLREKGKAEEARQGYKDIEIESRLLRTKVAELEGAAAKFSKMLSGKEVMDLKISRLERDLEYRDQEIDKLKLALTEKSRVTGELRAEAYHTPDEVELPPIILQRENLEARVVASPLEMITGRPSALKGRIVTINREHSFVVIDLGRQDGIDEGDRFGIYRDEVCIGSVEVIQMREGIAACDIKDVKEGYNIEIDDVVIEH